MRFSFWYSRRSNSSEDEPSGATLHVKARAAHAHDNGTLIIGHHTISKKKKSTAFVNSPYPPPTRKEIQDAKLRLRLLHKSLLAKSSVSLPDMDTEDMLSTMTLVLNEQRVLSMMYNDLLTHNIQKRILTGNNDERRPKIGVGQATPTYDTPSKTVRERAKEMEEERHETLWPESDALGPQAPVNNMLTDEDRKFIAQQIKIDASTVTSDKAIRQAAAVSVMAGKFAAVNPSIAHLPESVIAMDKLSKLHVDTRLAARDAVKTLVEDGQAAHATCDEFSCSGKIEFKS